MTAASTASRERRGTRRLCDGCEASFYDLARDPIVCPACGAEHTPHVRAVIEPRSPSATGRSGWGSSNRGRTPLVHTETANSESPDAEAVAADDLEETAEDAAGVVADDDIVLETEGDDADASSLVEHEDDERKDA